MGTKQDLNYWTQLGVFYTTLAYLTCWHTYIQELLTYAFLS
jgi:hypothetical protein